MNIRLLQYFMLSFSISVWKNKTNKMDRRWEASGASSICTTRRKP